MNDIKINAEWKPVRKDQAHKKIITHLVVNGTNNPVCKPKLECCSLVKDRIEVKCGKCLLLLEHTIKSVLRKCKDCGFEARSMDELNLFAKDKTMVHGRSNYCKFCLSKYGKQNHHNNKEKINLRHKLYRQQHPNYFTHWYENNKPKCIARTTARRKNPLLTSCSYCGSSENLVRHHPDYNKPEEIIVVCRSCHDKIHSKYGERRLVD